MTATDHPRLLLPPPTYPAVLFGLTWLLDGEWFPPFPPEAAWATWLGGVLVHACRHGCQRGLRTRRK